MAPNLDKPSFHSRIANCLEEVEEEEGRPIFLLPDHLIFLSDSDTESDSDLPLAPPPTPRPHEWVDLGGGMEMVTGIMPLDYENYLISEFRSFNGEQEHDESLAEPNSLGRGSMEERETMRNFLTWGFLWNSHPLSEEQIDSAMDDFGDFFSGHITARQHDEPELVARWNRAQEDEVQLEWRQPEPAADPTGEERHG